MPVYSIRNVRPDVVAPDGDSPCYQYQYDFYKNGKKVNTWYMDVDREVTLADLRAAMQKMKNADMAFHCIDCSVHTGEIDEYYMVWDKVWLLANPGDDGMLCVGCLEERIGRELTPADFTNFPVNRWNNKSTRLKERLGYGVESEVEVSGL